jgi:hypothetical protein
VLVIATYCGVFVWYWGMHQDRYLQVLLPWMAAATAATLGLAWRASRWTKLPVLALIVLQIAWGSDVPFIPGHAMLGKAPTVASIELAATGYRQQTKGRLNMFEPWQSMSKALDTRNSCVLLHEQQISLGIGTMVLQDFAHMQGLIDYGSQRSLGGVYDMLKGAGVTHIVWQPRTSTGWGGWAGDFIFFDFLREHTGPTQTFGGNYLAKLKAGPDLDLRGAKALFLVCPCAFANGLYTLPSLNFPDVMISNAKLFPRPERRLESKDEADDMLREARYVAYEPSCLRKTPKALKESFEQLASRGAVQIWVRKTPTLRE